MEEKNKGGRPKKEIDWKLVENLASIMCTQKEIASVLNVDVKTLRGHEEFLPILQKGYEKGKASLRRIQFKLAERNASMAIFLGKQYLDQKDTTALNREYDNAPRPKEDDPHDD